MSRFFANRGFIEGGSQYRFSTDLLMAGRDERIPF
jgi:hypothetical protein